MIGVILGIQPPISDKLWQRIYTSASSSSSTSTVDVDVDVDVPVTAAIEWRDHSLVYDEGMLTSIISAILTDTKDDDDDDDEGYTTTTTVTPEDAVQTMKMTLRRLKMNDLDNDIGREESKEISSAYHVELWASTPVPISLTPSVGFDQIVRLQNNHANEIDIDDPTKSDESSSSHHPKSSSSPWEYWGEKNMREWGIIVQENILNSNQLHILHSIVHSAIQNIEEKIKIHRPEIKFGQDTFFFQEIASRNKERFDLKMTDDKSIKFVQDHIYNHPNVKAFLEKSLGSTNTTCIEEDIDFDISVVYSRPGAPIQGWHADGSHQKGMYDAGWTKDGWDTQLSTPYAICLFLPLIDLNDEVGFTQFWPSSHRSMDYIGFGPVAEITNVTFDGKCEAGSGVWYDYRLLHRGMPNTSNVVRPVLQVVFKKKWYIERVNFGQESIICEKS